MPSEPLNSCLQSSNTNRNNVFNPFFFSQTTADLHNELAKENIQILASETFAEDPTAQVKSLQVSYHLAYSKVCFM